MTNGRRQAIGVGVALVALMAAGGCGRDQGEGSPAERAAQYAKGLQAKVTLDGTMAHLQKLQEIAERRLVLGAAPWRRSRFGINL